MHDCYFPSILNIQRRFGHPRHKNKLPMIERKRRDTVRVKLPTPSHLSGMAKSVNRVFRVDSKKVRTGGMDWVCP